MKKPRLATILSGGAVIGVGTTGYFASKAGEEYAKVKDSLKDADKKTKVKVLLPIYAKTLVSGTVTCGFIIAADRINAKDISKLTAKLAVATAGAAKLTENFKAYRNEVINEVGEEKEAEIRKKAFEHVMQDPETGMVERVYKFHIDWLGEDLYFYSTKGNVLNGALVVNYILSGDDDYVDSKPRYRQASVSDFLIAIGHPELISKASDRAGWDSEMLEAECGVTTMKFETMPQIDYKGEMYYDIWVPWVPWEDFIGARQLYDEARSEETKEFIKKNLNEELPFN